MRSSPRIRRPRRPDPVVPPERRHVIKEAPDGFALVTYYGLTLKTFRTRAEAQRYYAYHCLGSDLTRAEEPS